MKDPLFFPLSARTSTARFTPATARFKAVTGGSSLPTTESSYWSRFLNFIWGWIFLQPPDCVDPVEAYGFSGSSIAWQRGRAAELAQEI